MDVDEQEEEQWAHDMVRAVELACERAGGGWCTMEAAAAVLREKHWHLGRLTAAELEGELQKRWRHVEAEMEEAGIEWDQMDAAFRMEE